ncbi:IclR family transcriptional regulator [Paenibacillus algorifonticola]|uniref:IclR family transcriptional regulator n=1 Tax=Paenibacillus algorifonticola TaxID=684063 RepID=UPI003D271C14
MVQSIDRAMQIIQLLMSDHSRTGWAISDISERVDLPLSTTHRLISTLVKHELIVQLPETKRYRLGPKWMEVGLQQLEQLDLRTAARPIMERLADEVKETVFLTIPYGLFSMGVDKVDSSVKPRVVEGLGERIAMHIGASNKVILANMKRNEAEALLVRLVDDQEKRMQLLSALPGIKKAGYAVSYAEMTEGTAAISSPIIGFGRRVVGALGIGVSADRLTDERLDDLSKQVIQGAHEITTTLGG